MRLIGPEGPADLRPKTFDVLRYLVDHPRRVVRKDEIISAVWPDVVVTDESLTRCISEIRRALGSQNQSLVRTVQRRGYIFEGHVTESENAVGPAEVKVERSAANPNPAKTTDVQEHATPAKKQVTVLHVNCEACLAEVSSSDPERALGTYRLILAELTRICDRLGGRVTSVTEFSMAALFGAPSASEDHAVQACQAALEFRAATSRLPSENRSELLGIGLASGEVIVAPLAELAHADTILGIGSASHVARRLSSESRGSILISSSTQEKVFGICQTEVRQSSGTEAVAHELIGSAAAQTRFQGMAVRGLTPFVGRDLELNQLKRAAAVAFGGRGQVVAVIGEPGIGKSRLLYELVHALPIGTCEVLVAGAPSHCAPTSFQVLSNLIKTYLRITPEDDAATRRGKVLAVLRNEENIELLACLALIDEVVEDAAWTSLEPSLRRERTLAVGKKLLLSAAQRQPLLVVLEDLHWLDAESQEATNSLIDGIASMPVLLLVSYRPEYAHKWHGRSYYSQIHLDELSEEKRRELLVHLLGKDEHLVDSVGLLHRQGNPLFLEELVRSLADAHILEGRVGAHRLVRPMAADLRVPAAVQAVLSARIDKLPSRARLVLQAASVVGDAVPVEILRRVVGLPERELEAGLAELQAAEFFYEIRSSSSRSYRFKHALTRGVAYESQLRDQRAALHRGVVSAIEEIYPHRRLEHIEQLAHHAIRARLGDVAISYAMLAGTKAFSRFANLEAVMHYEEALAALEAVPESRRKSELAVDIRCELRNALYPLAEWGRIETYLKEAEQIASTLDDGQRLGWVSAYLSSLYLTGGKSAGEARKLAARAASLATAGKNKKLYVAAQYYLIWADYIAADYEGAERICRRVMAGLRGTRSRERFGVVIPAIQSRAYCARALTERGEFAEAEELAREAVRLSIEFDHAFSLAWSLLALGHVLATSQKLEEAGATLERALEECQRWKISSQPPLIMARLGSVRAALGRIAEGAELLERAVQDYDKTGMEHFLSISIVQWGEACLAAHQMNKARTCAQRALDLSTRRGERGFAAWALRLTGEIARAEGHDMDLARQYLSDALKQANRLKMRPLAARCHFDLYLLSRQIGAAEAARQHKATADALCTDLGLPPWPKSDWSEPRLRSVV